ncbi:MAG: 2-oxo acid dehydrogenase subunit E2, partial [Pseudomonadota bacterium]
MTNKIRLSGMRSTIGTFIHVSSRINPIFLTADIRAAALKQYCSRRSLTYTPVLMKIIAGIKDTYPIINSILGRDITLRQHIYLFNDVDMSISIEKTVDGVRFVTTPLIRNVNRKTVTEISEEVKLLARMPFHERPDVKPILVFNRLPGFLKYLVLRVICRSHLLFRRFFGTIGFTNLGNLGIGYLYPHWLNTVVFGIGSLENKPVAVNNTIEIVPVLPVTMAFN